MTQRARVPAGERARRVAHRHRLHPQLRADDLHDATASVVALHATDPASIHLGLLARTRAVTPEEIDEALYDRRTLTRVLAMRRTIFVVRTDDVAVPFAACSIAVAARERARLEMQLAGGSDVEHPATFVDAAMDAAATAVAAAGVTTARELTRSVPLLQTPWNPSPQSKWGAPSPVTSRILSQLSMEGVVERARPTGASFTSTAFRWRLADPGLVERARAIDPDQAVQRLVGDWLARFGPATEDDIVWWTGLNKTPVRRALTALGVEPVDLDGTEGLALPDDLGTTDDPGRWVALLPGLDPTPMGWKRRDHFVGPHTPELFDRAGNIGPTVWADGRIVGGWGQRRDGEVVVGLLEDLDDEATDLLDTEVTRVRTFLGDVVVTPRFRSPLEKRLAASGG